MKETRKAFACFSGTIDTLFNVTAVLGGLLILLMMLSITYEVVMRYFFKSPSTWVADSSGLMLYAVTFLTTGWVLKRNGHVRVDLVVIRFSSKTQMLLQGIVHMFAFFACAVVLVQSLIDAVSAYQTKEVLWLAFSLPKHLVLWLIPVGFLLLCIQCFRKALSDFHIFGQMSRKGPEAT